MPKGYENAEMRDSEYSPRQQSSHSSLRTGKPSTWQRGTVNHFKQKGRCVRHYEKSDSCLESLEEKASVSNYKYERLYRNLYNPEFYLLAYANIAKSQGSMTQGWTGRHWTTWACRELTGLLNPYATGHTSQSLQKKDTFLKERETSSVGNHFYWW